MRVTLRERPPQLKHQKGERDALATLAGLLAEAEWQPQPLHDLFYAAQEASGLLAKALFELVYRALLGQSRGPRLGFFLATLDRERSGVTSIASPRAGIGRASRAGAGGS